MAPLNSLLVARQSSGTANCPDTLSGGAVAGIVIGSIAGTILLMWLWRACQQPGAWSGGVEPVEAAYGSPVVTSRRRRRRRPSSGTYAEYVEKPSSTRRYRDDLRRPESVYLAER